MRPSIQQPLVVCIAGLCVIAMIAACNDKRPSPPPWVVPAEAAAIPNPQPATAASIERGKQLFEQHCLGCHGYYGEGDGIVGPVLEHKPANLLRISGVQSPGEFAWKISSGRSNMPAFRDKLAQEDIWNIVNFVQALESRHDAQSRPR